METDRKYSNDFFLLKNGKDIKYTFTSIRGRGARRSKTYPGTGTQRRWDEWSSLQRFLVLRRRKTPSISVYERTLPRVNTWMPRQRAWHCPRGLVRTTPPTNSGVKLQGDTLDPPLFGLPSPAHGPQAYWWAVSAVSLKQRSRALVGLWVEAVMGGAERGTDNLAIDVGGRPASPPHSCRSKDYGYEHNLFM